MRLIKFEDYFVFSLCSLEMKYNWKSGFEPHCTLDAKYDDASLILYVIYDIESKTLILLFPVDLNMRNMIGF
jgi:hypothetical protein